MPSEIWAYIARMRTQGGINPRNPNAESTTYWQIRLYLTSALSAIP